MPHSVSPFKDDMSRRLRRIEGQVRGIQKMIEDGSPPENILQQLSAVSSAVHAAGKTIIQDQFTTALSTPEDLTGPEFSNRLKYLSSLLDRLP